MVIPGGVNIYPAEIEMALLALPGVRDCAVFGIPDEEFGETLCAHIEPDPKAPPVAGEITAFLRERLADFKAASDQVRDRLATRGFRQDHQTQIASALLGADWAEYLERTERLAMTDEPLARQMDRFAFVFDHPADNPRAPAVPLENRQGGIGVFL